MSGLLRPSVTSYILGAGGVARIAKLFFLDCETPFHSKYELFGTSQFQ
jgi:hypothetical protein